MNPPPSELLPGRFAVAIITNIGNSASKNIVINSNSYRYTALLTVVDTSESVEVCKKHFFKALKH